MRSRCAGIQNSVVCWSVRPAGGERIEWIRLVDVAPGASGSERSDASGITSGSLNRCDDPERAHRTFHTSQYHMANTRLSRCAHPKRPGHRVGLWFRALLFFYGFLRNNVFTQFAIGREHPMESCQIHPWSGYQRCQAPHEFHWAEWGRLRTT